MWDIQSVEEVSDCCGCVCVGSEYKLCADQTKHPEALSREHHHMRVLYELPLGPKLKSFRRVHVLWVKSFAYVYSSKSFAGIVLAIPFPLPWRMLRSLVTAVLVRPRQNQHRLHRAAFCKVILLAFGINVLS